MPYLSHTAGLFAFCKQADEDILEGRGRSSP